MHFSTTSATTSHEGLGSCERRSTSVGSHYAWTLVSTWLLRSQQPTAWGLSILTAPLILSTGDNAGAPAILSMCAKSYTFMRNDFRTAPPVTGRRRDVMPLPVFIRGGHLVWRMGRRAESAFGEWTKTINLQPLHTMYGKESEDNQVCCKANVDEER